jgi:hypothetical protein
MYSYIGGVIVKKFLSIALAAIFAFSIFGASGASAASQTQTFSDPDVGTIVITSYTFDGYVQARVKNDWKDVSVVVNLQVLNGGTWTHVDTKQQYQSPSSTADYYFSNIPSGRYRFHVKMYSKQTGSQIAGFQCYSFEY